MEPPVEAPAMPQPPAEPRPPAEPHPPAADQPPPQEPQPPLAEQPHPPTDQPHPPTDQPHPPTDQPHPPTDQPHPPADGSVKQDLLVPRGTIGAIIGSGGSQVMSIERESGARVQIPSREAIEAADGKAFVAIIGSQEQVTVHGFSPCPCQL